MSERKSALLQAIQHFDTKDTERALRKGDGPLTNPSQGQSWDFRNDPYKASRYYAIPDKPDVTSWQGYLENTRDPWALNFAPMFWQRRPDGTALPFNDETYNVFNQIMNERFLRGEIPGVIRYDQPSKDEIKTILQNAGVGGIDYAHTKAASRPSKIQKADKRGPPGVQKK
jgi:hypothetical protein